MADETKPEDNTDVSNNPEGGITPPDGAQKPDIAQGTAEEASKGDVVTREEFDGLFKRMQAADQAKSKAENELNEIKRKDQTELERAKGDLENITAERDDLKKQLNDTRLENAFLSNNKHTWHDPGDAMHLLDMSGVVIGDDGKVSGLDSAIDSLAKKKPHLIKPVDDGEGSNRDSGTSGTANNGSRKGSAGTKPDMSSRFPALKKSPLT